MLGNGESSLQQLGTVLQQQNQAFKLAFEIHTHTNKRGHTHTRAAITPTHTVTHTHTDCSVDTHTHTHIYSDACTWPCFWGEAPSAAGGEETSSDQTHTEPVTTLSFLSSTSPPSLSPSSLFLPLSLSLSLSLLNRLCTLQSTAGGVKWKREES